MIHLNACTDDTMKIWKVLIQSICLGLLIALAHYAQSATIEKKISWVVLDAPPGFILEGADKGKGFIDLLMKFYQEKLENYEHKLIRMNYTRFFVEVKRGSNICGIGASKSPQREEVLHYSAGAIIFPPDAIVVRTSDLKDFGAGKTLSLKKLLDNSSLRGEFVLDRAYRPELDLMLSDYKRNKKVFVTTRTISQLFEKLLLKRIDYTILDLREASYFKNKFDSKDEISTVAIEEIIADYQIGHVVCTKNDWGKKVISDLNVVLLKERPTKEYRELAGKYLNQKTRQAMQEFYDEVFVKTEK